MPLVLFAVLLLLHIVRAPPDELEVPLPKWVPEPRRPEPPPQVGETTSALDILPPGARVIRMTITPHPKLLELLAKGYKIVGDSDNPSPPSGEASENAALKRAEERAVRDEDLGIPS